MSLNDTMTALMDKAREVTGVTGQLSVSDATNSLLNTATGGTMFYQNVDLSSSDYDQNTWYPVYSSKYSKNKMDHLTAGIPSNGDIKAVTWGNWGAKSDTDLTPCPAMAWVDLLMNHFGYGYNNEAVAYVFFDEFNKVRDNKNPILYDQNPNNGGYVFWLRGGAAYSLGINLPNNTWTIVKSTTTINDVTLKPQTNPQDLQLGRQTVKSYVLSTIFSKLGGVVKAVLSALLPVRGCFA